MKINWNPSEKVRAFAKYIYEQKKTKTYDQLVEETGYSRNYLIMLNKWQEQQEVQYARQ